MVYRGISQFLSGYIADIPLPLNNERKEINDRDLHQCNKTAYLQVELSLFINISVRCTSVIGAVVAYCVLSTTAIGIGTEINWLV